MVEGLQHAKTDRGRADSSTGQSQPHDIDHFARPGIFDRPRGIAARVYRRNLARNNIMVVFAPGFVAVGGPRLLHFVGHICLPMPAVMLANLQLSARAGAGHHQPIASSSSIMPAITDSPPSQNFGSLASRPNGLSSSE